MAGRDKKRQDLISRGKYGPSPLGTTVFVFARALDGLVIQRALQLIDPLPALFSKMGINVPPPPSGGAPLSVSSHALTPFQAVFWVMSIAAALKQIIWVMFTSKEEMTLKTAIIVGFFNCVGNSISTLAFSLSGLNPTWSVSGLYISIPIFTAGILIESISEFQRKIFKDDPKNKGKVFSGGLFSYARHINFLGYLLWRTSMALAGGGWVFGVAVGSIAWQRCHSTTLPVLDEYCANKYKEQWQATKRKVPYALLPGVK